MAERMESVVVSAVTPMVVLFQMISSCGSPNSRRLPHGTLTGWSVWGATNGGCPRSVLPWLLGDLRHSGSGGGDESGLDALADVGDLRRVSATDGPPYGTRCRRGL